MTGAWLIYHFYFDPLRSFPCPRLWAMTMLPWHYHNTRGQLATHINRLHRKHGPMVRVGPNELSLVATSLDDWRTIYNARPEMGRAVRGTGLVPPINGANDIGVANLYVESD